MLGVSGPHPSIFLIQNLKIDSRKPVSMIEIDCEVQNYSWGKKGRDSIVATLKESSSSTFALSESQTYAELWMGTHPSGPAKLRNSSTLLSQWIKQHKDVVGIVPTGYPHDDLPFLFKILSVQTALSIQAHPDKELAKKLFAQFPDVYKDDNHKPEMTIALTDFECLCGFRLVKDIQDNFKRYPELLALISSTAPELDCCGSSPSDTKEWIKALFGAYMNASDQLVQEHLNAMVSRLRTAANATSLTSLDKLILRLEGEYPGDKGVFAPCLLNYLCLAPGESFFIGANEPHAYLSGDCVECMALSDNVVRAGLTPKFKDVHTLCNMLHYNCGPPVMLQPLALDMHTPPLQSCAEFEVEVCRLPAHTAAYCLPGGNYASLVVATQGDGAVFSLADQSISVSRGTVLFLAADSKLMVSTEDQEIVFFRAHINCSAYLM